MKENDLIRKDDEICLLEDDYRIFLIHKDGSYMPPVRMIDLAHKMINTAYKYGNAINEYNNKRMEK